MVRTAVFSETASIQNFQAISSPRRIRLAGNDYIDPDRRGPSWDYLRISHRADTTVYVGLNGVTAASTASTFTVPPFVATPNRTPIFGVHKTAALEIWSKATSLSLQASGGTAVGVSIVLGRF